MRHILLSVFLLGACGGGPSASYGGAAMAAAGGVVQTAIYRKVTGYSCWAQCQQGFACNKETNMCERIPCGGCPASEHCQVSGSIETCVPETHVEQTDPATCGVPDASVLLRVPCDASAD